MNYELVMRSGYCWSSVAAMTARFARTSSREMPGRMRPRMASQPVLSSGSRLRPGSRASCMVSGTQNWLGQGSRPRKPAAATPITVNFVRLSEMVLPRMLGSAAN